MNAASRSNVVAAAEGRLAARLSFVASVADAGTTPAGGLRVVLDTAWSAGPGDDPGVVPLRPHFAAAIEAHDLFEDALDLVDSWAVHTNVADLLIAEGATYWFRVCESLWHWVHERLLWHYALASIDARQSSDLISVPRSEQALIEVAAAQGRAIEIQGEPDGPTDRPASRERPAASRYVPPIARRAFRWFRPRPEAPATAENRRRTAILEARLERRRRSGAPLVVVLAVPSNYQHIGTPGGLRRRDPNLGSVIPALADAGLETVVIGWRMRIGRDDDWTSLELDERLLPSDFFQSRWGRPEDDQRAEQAVDGVLDRLGSASGTSLDIGGTDLTAPFMAALRSVLREVINTDVHELARAERLIADLRPKAILMSQEGNRTAWLNAGARARVPTYAVQHGVLYRTHPGYPVVRHAALVLPSSTFVYGDFSRRVLLAGAYLESEVETTGSPRLELDPGQGPTDPASAEVERAGVRREVGVADADRMLVISTVNLEFIRRSHQAHMLERLLGGPLPRVHLVFKQHPAERDGEPYRALIAGLARAGGYDSPPVTVVRDIDLYRLLRSADAHLGLHSTVLTDAVAAGTPNLIAIVDGHADLLGYVAAGVARPVASVGDVLAALDHPVAADPVARQAFLDDHFRPGLASQRIVDSIGVRLG